MTQPNLRLIEGLNGRSGAARPGWHGTGTLPRHHIRRDGQVGPGMRATTAQESTDLASTEADGSQFLSAADLLRALHATLDPVEVVDCLHAFILPVLGHRGVRVELNDGSVLEAGHPHGIAQQAEIACGSDRLGVLAVYTSAPNSADTGPLLRELAGSLHRPLVNALRHQEALSLARHDALTRMPNRGALDETLPAEVELAHRHDLPLSLLVIDVDGFKQINDAYGHLVGDRLLCHVASVLQASERADDLTFRYAGDEFVMVLRHTDATGAEAAARRLRQRLQESEPPQEAGVRLAPEISVGQATLRPDETSLDLFRRADMQLLAAKGY